MTGAPGDAKGLDADTLARHRQFIEHLARRVLGDRAEVLDVVQDTSLAALTRSPATILSVRAWLGTVTRNLALASGRSSLRRRRREAALARPEATEETAALVIQRETRRRLVLVVLALDEPYRTMILWRYFEGLSPAEIATRRGVPRGTVKTQLKRALAMMRTRLVDRDEARPRMPSVTVLACARAWVSHRPRTNFALARGFAGPRLASLTALMAIAVTALLILCQSVPWVSAATMPRARLAPDRGAASSATP